MLPFFHFLPCEKMAREVRERCCCRHQWDRDHGTTSRCPRRRPSFVLPLGHRPWSLDRRNIPQLPSQISSCPAVGNIWMRLRWPPSSCLSEPREVHTSWWRPVSLPSLVVVEVLVFFVFWLGPPPLQQRHHRFRYCWWFCPLQQGRCHQCLHSRSSFRHCLRALQCSLGVQLRERHQDVVQCRLASLLLMIIVFFTVLPSVPVGVGVGIVPIYLTIPIRAIRRRAQSAWSGRRPAVRR